jgi:tRNA nucleotidyltransferase (CCA-adding enzyme)
VTEGDTAQGAAVVEALAELPGGAELLDTAKRRPDIALVGGAVRDLLIGRKPRELDVTVAEDSAKLAAELASRLPRNASRAPDVTLHERFGTVVVDWIHGRIDIAERRAEDYPYPGALPEVRPGSARDDLARRDFTVNAIALPLGGERRGELEAVDDALEDLAAGRLRVLHEGSFLDDPTRLLRLGRYRARLGFSVERQTARLAAEALAAGSLQTVSGGRIAAELWLAQGEGGLPAHPFSAFAELGILTALSLPSPFDEQLLFDSVSLLPPDGVLEILEMAVLFHPASRPTTQQRGAAADLMVDFEFFAETRERVLSAAFDSHDLAAGLDRTERPSELHGLLADQPVETVGIAGALASPPGRERARDWIERLRHVQLEIDGTDLLDAGVPEGPEVGRRLRQALDAKLDGELDGGGGAAELKAALA